jgi:hypothetical protein
MGGDATAAGNLPGVANTLLGIGKSYYGSTAAYAGLFGDVSAGTGAVQDQFGASLDTQQQMLAELKKQNQALQDQLAVQTAQLGAQQQSAQLQAVQSVVNSANTVGAGTSQGQGILGQLRTMFPGLQFGIDQARGQVYLLNQDLRNPADYALGINQNTPFGDLPGNVQALVVQRHLRWLTGFDPDGNPTYQQFARGGDFGGGIMRLGSMAESRPELLAVGPSRVMTSEQLNAPTVAAIARLEHKFDQLIAAQRDGSRTARIAHAARSN